MNSREKLIQALQNGATVLTANERAARSLRRAWDDHNVGNKARAWQPAAVLTLDAWCTQRWGDLLAAGVEDRLMLSPLQEHAVWQRIVEGGNRRAATSALETLESPQALASEALRANALLCDFEAHAAFERAQGNQSTEAFRGWLKSFQQECQKNRLLPRAALLRVLTMNLQKKSLPLAAQEFLLVGFDRYTPAQTALLDAMRALGCRCEAWAVSADETDAVRAISYASPQEELHAVAVWAKELMQNDPAVRIAVVLPKAAERRAEVERVFRRVLAPRQMDTRRGMAALPFEFSLGLPMASQPMVAAALAMLRWCTQPLPFEEAAALLRSAWFCNSPEEQSARVRFELDVLRRSTSLLPEVGLDEVLRQVRRHNLGENFAGILKLRTALMQSAARRSFSEWGAQIGAALQAAGWPGVSLNSTEFQVYQRWKELLDELTRLDFERANVGLAVAVRQLQTMAKDLHFAPESLNAPVQVLGVLEAAGSEFDAVWFAGATASAWPAHQRTHPLLPWRLQYEFKMPHADVAEEFKLAEAMQARIRACSPLAVFSHYREDGDGEQQASPLLHALGVKMEEAGEMDSTTLQLHSLPLETADAAGAIAPPPEMTLRGGMRILQSQALCPFRAFAEHRLNSTSPTEIEFGMDARESGSVVHVLLEKFWKETRSQAAMLAETREARAEKLHALALAQLEMMVQPENEWERSAVRIQAEAMAQLLVDWLAVEAQRAPFEVASAELELRDVRIGPLQMNLRCDRIDTTDNGSVLIDYKTGLPKTKHWDTARPEEPQLPLYAVAQEATGNSAAGIAFARVRPGEMELTGISNAPGVFSAAKSAEMRIETADMQQRTAEWRQVLTKLAEDFHSGTPSVDPKDIRKTCKYCGQRALCRVDSLGLMNADAEDAESEAAHDGNS